MKARLLAAVAAMAASGCAPQVPERREPPRVEVVRVPVAVPCARPRLPPRPRLPLADLPEDAPPAEVLRAYLVSIELLTGYARELETIAGAGAPPEEGR